MFVNDRTWNLKQARDYKERMERALKHSYDETRKGDLRQAASDSRTAAVHQRSMEQYERAARLCTK